MFYTEEDVAVCFTEIGYSVYDSHTNILELWLADCALTKNTWNMEFYCSMHNTC